MKISKKLFWVFNFLILGLFSSYAVGGTLGLGGQRAYADTLDNGNFYRQGKNFVVVHDNGQNASPINSEEICSLTPTQVAELDAFFKVRLTNITIHNGGTIQIATISGHHLTRAELMQFLRASDHSLVCHIVGTNHIFFLPVLPQIS